MTTLGQYCLEWCKKEKAFETRPSVTTLARWFALAERGLEGMVLAGKKLNHCAIAQAAALQHGLERMGLPPDWEHAPHGYRAGAKQLMLDAIGNNCWHASSEVVSGEWFPEPGDLAVYDRSKPGRPETSWWGHVDRVIHVGDTVYTNIGANEGPGGDWVVQVGIPYTHPKLLGFVAYPRAEPEPPKHPLSEQEVRRIKALVALTIDESESAWWEDNREAEV